MAADINLVDLLSSDVSQNGSKGFTLFGGVAGDLSGFSVSSAGDVNGDGFDDVLIGATYAYGPTDYTGESYVVFGKADFSGSQKTINLGALNGTDGFTLFGVNGYDETGAAVSSAGDVNGDGFDDLLIGAPEANSDKGAGYVVFGKADFSSTPIINLGALNGTDGFTLLGADADDRSGNSVSGAGDVNGDGFDDLLIGAPDADGLTNLALNTGESYVVFGKADFSGTPTIDLGTLSSPDGFTLFGVNADHRSGVSVSGAGDVNGDGFEDLLIGARLANGAAGGSYVVFGKANFSATSTFELADLLPANGGDGSVGITLSGVDLFDESGVSVSSAGDVNGDGFDDLLIGAYYADGSTNSASKTGESYVVFGKADFSGTPNIDLSNLTGTNGFTLFGVDAFDRSGRSVSDAGDVNGDGFDDLLIGAYFADGSTNSSSNTGESYLVFGKADFSGTPTIDLSSLTGTDGFTLFGVDSNDHSSRSVSNAGDVNGDGFDDLLIGAHYADGGGNNAGESYVVFGGDPPLSVTQNGTSGPDTLSGTVAIDVLVGGQDDDLLVGAGGADVLRGGEGDDVLAVGDLNFSRIVGGNGFDTLRLDTSGASLDLTTLPDNRVLDVEQIDITGLSPNTLTLDVQEVLNISCESNTLRILGDGDDTIDIGGGWTDLGTEMLDGNSYEVFQQGTARLEVASSIGSLATGFAADFSGDGDVDGFDFLAWQRGFGTLAPNASKGDGDADNDKDVDGDDLIVWKNQYGMTSASSIVVLVAASEPVAAKSIGSQTLAPASEPLSAELVDAAIVMDQALRSEADSLSASTLPFSEDQFDWFSHRARWSEHPAGQGPSEIANHTFRGLTEEASDGSFSSIADDDAANDALLDQLFAEDEFGSLL